MNKRVGTSGSSNKGHLLRCTEDELESYKALAKYRSMTLSALLRHLLDAERQRLVAEGKKPPRRLRE
jgi:hypothetical protein